MITVRTKEEAWMVVNRISPCDYVWDANRSQNGYDVFSSTNPDICAWINDLGDRLEVNLPNVKSVNIWIKPEITYADLKRIQKQLGY